MSTTMIAPLQRRHLNPLSPKKRMALQNLNNIGNISNINRLPKIDSIKGFSLDIKSLSKLNATPALKRTFTLHDENANTNSCSTKRIKSALCENTLITIPSHPVLVNHATKTSQQPVKSVKENTKSSAPKASPKGVKRNHARFEEAKVRKPTGIRRVDPPQNHTGPISIASVLHESSSRNILHPVSRSKSTWKSYSGGKCPESWMFQIHEDTLEETLTNLVHHQTGTLEISDDEEEVGAKSDLERKGKENIPPTPDVDALAMPPPPAPRTVDLNAMDAERTRSPLGEVLLKVENKEQVKVDVKNVSSSEEVDAVAIPLPTITEEEEALLAEKALEILVQSVLGKSELECN